MEARKTGACISRAYIQARARKITHETRTFCFVGANGWLVDFLKRHRLSLRRITTTGRALPADSINIVREHSKMRKLRMIYSHHEVFNMDETNIQLDFPGQFESISLN